MPIDTVTPGDSRKAMQESRDFKTVAAGYPHLGEKLVLFWGEPEFGKLVDELQQNWRNEHRAGFTADVLLALEGIAAAHDSAYPKLARREKDFWNLSNAR